MGHVKSFVSVEMNNGQMINDIKLATDCSKPVSLVNRMGGNLITVDDVVRHVRQLAQGGKIRAPLASATRTTRLRSP